MNKFLEWLAFPMERPQSYSAFHLIFAFVGLAVVIVAAILLRKLNDKQNKIMLGCIGVVLAISEIIKILFNNHIINNDKFAWWVFPYQLCSIPMYLCLICPFVKNEKINNWLYEFMFAIGLSTSIATLAEPSGLHKDYVFLTYHAYIWHLVLVFIGLYLFLSKRAGKNLYGVLKSSAVFAVVSVIGLVLNLTIKEPGFNALYMSPYVPSKIVVFDQIWLKAGWLVCNILYMIAIILLSAIFYYSAYFIRKYVEKRKSKKYKYEYIG